MKKKLFVICLAALCCLWGGLPVKAQEVPESASTEIFKFAPFDESILLELFVKAIEDGRKYPTMEEFEAAGFGLELGFVRSHVRPRQVMIDKEKQLYPALYEKRNLWMNTPTGIGAMVGGFPNGSFSDDVFSMWNYTNLYGCWNHSLFQAPASWVDTGHKNGTDMFSGIKFFESWGTGDGGYVNFITAKNPDGSFKYAKAFIYCLMYFGSDGINYNWEDSSYGNEDVIAFHKELYKIAAQEGFTNFHIGIYTSNSTLTSRYVDALYGTKETGKTTDLMLNYSSGDFSYGIQSSVQTAESAYGNADGLYTGVWIVTMNRRWSALNQNAEAKRCGVCLWGEHTQSRFMSYNAGSTNMELQANYQKLLERGFSGGYRNPAKLPPVSDTGNNWELENGKEPLSTFCGLASFIPERSAIQGNLPFNTFFSLGNGERYNYKGIKTHGSWYNMGAQDIVPTYRWLVYEAGSKNVSTDLQPAFTHEDAYIGGSALSLTGTVTDVGTDVILYKTKLNVSGSKPVAKVAVKSGKSEPTATNLYLILKKEGNNEWIEVPVGDTKGTTWELKELPLTAVGQNDVIESIGLRVAGDYIEDYKMLVGKLELSDGASALPAPIKANSLVIEVKEETTKSMSVKMNWEVDATGLSMTRSGFDLLYNDEANIDHFEVLYKNGEDGKITEIARTTTWSDFIGGILFENASDEPYIGVRSASIDFDTYSPIQWVKIERSTSPYLPVYHEASYGETYINTSSDGVSVARVQRYIESFTTSGADQNISYTASGPQSDGTQYVDATDYVMKVHQGQAVRLTFKAHDEDDGLKWCFAKGYMDLDQSFSFEPDGDESVFDLGTIRAATPEFQTGCTQNFTIPTDAAPGKSRLRIVFSDAWFSHPGPTGGTSKGFSIDFGVEITGENEARPTPPDSHDQGEAVEPDRVRDEDPTIPSGIETSKEDAGFSKMSSPAADGTVSFTDVEKAWVYTTSGRLVKFVDGNPTNMNICDLAGGLYVVKMQFNQVVRSQKLYKE